MRKTITAVVLAGALVLATGAAAEAKDSQWGKRHAHHHVTKDSQWGKHAAAKDSQWGS